MTLPDPGVTTPPTDEQRDTADHGYTVAALAHDLREWWSDREDSDEPAPDVDDVHAWLIDQARQMGANL